MLLEEFGSIPHDTLIHPKKRATMIVKLLTSVYPSAVIQGLD